jgi:transcriptional regulator with XRE-family HTH domain
MRSATDQRWRDWMIALGARVRHLRELVGLSQEQLAKQVGVSQGAISRLEMGRGMNTPLLLALRVYAGLASALREIDTVLLTDDARALIAQLEALQLPGEEAGSTPPAAYSLLVVPEFEQVVRLCSRVPTVRRLAFVKVVRALAAALCGTEEEDVTPEDARPT